MRTTGRGRTAGAALLVAGAALAAGATGAGAQADESPWTPWLGCWVEEEAPADAAMTCFVPEPAGVAMLTVTEAGVRERRTLRADGAEHPVEGGGCEGVEVVEPSADGTRLYTRSRLACEGGTERATRGLMAMVAPDRWVRVRAMTVGSGSASWVTGYRPAPADRVEIAPVDLEGVRALDLAVETARLAASGSVTADDIIEAHGRTESEAVRAWLAELAQPVELDAERLVRLADAGVSPEIIDVAIAISYPDRFAVARAPEVGAPADRWDRPDRLDRFGYGYGWRGVYSPYYYDPFYWGYSPYDRYGSYSYGMGGYYPYRPGTVIVVQPVDELPVTRGQAVKGRGYTRGTGEAAGPTAAPRGSVRAPSNPSASRGGYTSGSSRAAPSRATSSSGASSKGKAKPKGGGG
ncbi:MAG: hypothetical protein ACLFRX_08895 [Gemmatimonadota bacterium]